MMRIAWALLRAESIKLRRTLSPVVAVAAPLLMLFMSIIGLFYNGPDPRWAGPASVWHDLLRDGWAMWLALMTPTLVSFIAASLANLEHEGNQWKQLFVSPVPRWSIYAVKLVVCGVLIGVSFAVFALGFIGELLIFSGFEGLHLSSAMPWGEILSIAGRTFLACWPIVAIQTWLSVRFSGFGVPIGIGLAALVVGFMWRQLPYRVFSSWYPWTLPLSAHTGSGQLHNPVFPAVFGCVGGVLFGVLACWDLARRREQA